MHNTKGNISREKNISMILCSIQNKKIFTFPNQPQYVLKVWVFFSLMSL